MTFNNWMQNLRMGKTRTKKEQGVKWKVFSIHSCTLIRLLAFENEWNRYMAQYRALHTVSHRALASVKLSWYQLKPLCSPNVQKWTEMPNKEAVFFFIPFLGKTRTKKEQGVKWKVSSPSILARSFVCWHSKMNEIGTRPSRQYRALHTVSYRALASTLRR